MEDKDKIPEVGDILLEVDGNIINMYGINNNYNKLGKGVIGKVHVDYVDALIIQLQNLRANQQATTVDVGQSNNDKLIKAIINSDEGAFMNTKLMKEGIDNKPFLQELKELLNYLRMNSNDILDRKRIDTFINKIPQSKMWTDVDMITAYRGGVNEYEKENAGSSKWLENYKKSINNKES